MESVSEVRSGRLHMYIRALRSSRISSVRLLVDILYRHCLSRSAVKLDPDLQPPREEGKAMANRALYSTNSTEKHDRLCRLHSACPGARHAISPKVAAARAAVVAQQVGKA